MTIRYLCLIACLLSSSAVHAAPTTKPAPKSKPATKPATQPASQPTTQPSSEDNFEVRNVEGWLVYINRDVARLHPKAYARTLKHLRWELYQIKLAAPALAVSNMQENTPIWTDYQNSMGMAYHPSRKWLIERKKVIPRDPRSLVSLNAKGHVDDSYRHPFVVFHEMAHGYDYHFIGKGRTYGNKECQANYERMMKEGKYEKVRIWNGKVGSSYARKNRMEYFAENTEAYFAVNDIYPFVRAELREHDPKMARLIERYWGVDTARIARLEKQLADYKDRPSKPAAGPAGASSSAPATKPVHTRRYQKRNIDGWRVYVSEDLLKEPGRCAAMVTLLNYKLHMINHFIAEDGRKQLHEIPVWLEAGLDGPYIRYCGSRDEVRRAGDDPMKAGGVEVGDPHRMMKWALLQQSDVLGELAMAYYDRHAARKGSELGKKVSAAYEKAKANDKYKSVLRFDGRKLKHPALAGEKRYFAEMMKSYFLVNDHYPFIRCELKVQDPAGYKLIAGLWKGNPRR